MSSEQEEEDYMSDKIISECVSSETSTSSLLHSHKLRYEHQRYKRKLEYNQKSKKNIKQMEEERRVEALSKPLLNPENKGYQLLQKMIKCFPEGVSSKRQANTEARNDVEKLILERQPIKIEIKTGRKGLGNVEQQKKNKTDENTSLNKTKDLERRRENFLQNQIEKSEHYFIKKDFFQLQKICFNLDTAFNNLQVPIVPWYWPKSFRKELKKNTNIIEKSSNDEIESLKENSSDEDNEDEKIDYKSRLEELNEYVRQQYFYCIWCGCSFKSNEDLKTNCPGNTRQSH